MSEGSEGTTRAVLAAFAGNLLIAITKAIAAYVTGSGALVAETAHSIADSVNQILLYVGIRRSVQPPTEKHPLGHGKDVELVYDVSAGVPEDVVGDRGRLGQIVLNLVGNAIKYQRPGVPRVHISVQRFSAADRAGAGSRADVGEPARGFRSVTVVPSGREHSRSRLDAWH